MSTDAFEQLIDVAAPGGGSYPVQRGHRRGVRSPHTFDAARWPPSSLTSPYAPQGSTTAVLERFRIPEVAAADLRPRPVVRRPLRLVALLDLPVDVDRLSPVLLAGQVPDFVGDARR